MKVEVKGNLGDLSAMLLSAERYALGRRTYIVNWTCEFIERNLHLITENDKLVMIKDIRYKKEHRGSAAMSVTREIGCIY